MAESFSPAGSIAEEAEIVLEGWMLKQGRSKKWNERYFVFTSDQNLKYYHQKGDTQARGSFRITRGAGCEISDLYVEQRQKGTKKEALYCISVTVADDVSLNESFRQLMNESFPQRDDTSVHVGPTLDAPSSPQIPTKPIKGIRRHRSATPPPQPQGTFSELRERLSGSPPLPVGSTDNSLASVDSKKAKKHKGWFRRDNNNHNVTSLHQSFSGGFPSLEGDRKNQRNFNRRRQSSNSSLGIPGTIDIDDPLIPAYETILETSERDGCHSGDHGLRVVEETKVGGWQSSFHTQQDLGKSRSPTQRVQGGSQPSTPRGHDLNASKSVVHSSFVPTPYEKKQAAELDKLHTTYLSTKLENKKKTRKKMIEGTKLAAAGAAAVGVGVMTAGAGLAAGLIVLGATAAAGGTAVGAEAGLKRRKQQQGKVTFAAKSYEEAKLWKSSLEACLEFESVAHSKWGQLFIADGRKKTSALLPHDMELLNSRSQEGSGSPRDDDFPKYFRRSELPESQTNLFLKDRNFLVESNARWRFLEGGFASLLGSGTQGLRILREEKAISNLAVGGTTAAPLKSQIVLNAHPLDAFMCLMSYARIPSESEGPLVTNSGQRASFRVLESIDDHMDVVHVIWHPLYLFPSWTTPRDFVLFRYWRYEPDGSYIVCYESVEHSGCPPRRDFVRGEMHQVCTLAPTKNVGNRRATMSHGPECLLTSVVQVDPKGWVPTKPLGFLSNQGYADAFGIAALLQLLDISDAIDFDRFLDVAADTHQIPPSSQKPNRSMYNELGNDGRVADELGHYDFEFANRERLDSMTFDSVSGIESNPAPLDVEKWAEPDANSFLVRGHSYKQDRVKINAGTSIGRLIAVDVVLVDKPIFTGMSTHPTERIQLALKREKKLLANGKPSDMPPFIFVVNIVLPGPPFYHGVFYYAVEDISTIDGSDGTGSSLLCRQFLFGEDDEFRDRTFKLIPQIVQGNFMVRKGKSSR